VTRLLSRDSRSCAAPSGHTLANGQRLELPAPKDMDLESS